MILSLSCHYYISPYRYTNFIIGGDQRLEKKMSEFRNIISTSWRSVINLNFGANPRTAIGTYFRNKWSESSLTQYSVLNSGLMKFTRLWSAIEFSEFIRGRAVLFGELWLHKSRPRKHAHTHTHTYTYKQQSKRASVFSPVKTGVPTQRGRRGFRKEQQVWHPLPSTFYLLPPSPPSSPFLAVIVALFGFDLPTLEGRPFFTYTSPPFHAL